MTSDISIQDMSMLDLFKMETENHCLSLVHDLAMLEQSSEPYAVIENMSRAFHSIKGAASIVEVNAVVEITSAAEEILSVVAPEELVSENTVNTLNRCVDFLSQAAKQENDHLQEWLGGQKHTVAELHAAVRTLGQPEQQATASPPAKNEESQDEQPTTEPQFQPLPQDQDMNSLPLLGLFREDAEAHLQVLADNLLGLERNPRSLNLLESSMRSTHSIKGAARIVELNRVVALAHIMEDVFVAAQEGVLILSHEEIDVLLAAVDFLKDLLENSDHELPAWIASNDARGQMLVEMLDTVKQQAESAAAEQKKEKDDQEGSDKSLVEGKQQEDQKVVPGARTRSRTPSERHLKISVEGMGRLMSLAGEMLVESRWLPGLVFKSIRLKRYQDDLLRVMDRIKNELIEARLHEHINPALFDELTQRNQVFQNYIGHYVGEVEDHARNATEISHRLHKELIVNRMQPFSEGIMGFPRIVRDLARDLGKMVRLEVSGSGTMVDRDILEKIESPLNHIIANAIDHGVESPDERQRCGKPREAVISIQAKHVHGILRITICDDGRGIDLEQLRHTVIQKNLVSEKIARSLSEAELTEFLFLPNFSTRDAASKISGRGVGLDVVHSAVREIRGSVSVSSVMEKGTAFELQLPITLSITRSLITSINREPYAFPLVKIDHVVRLSKQDIMEMEGRQYFVSKGKRIGIISAQQVLELKDNEAGSETMPVIILHSATNSYGLIVDSFDGIKDLIIQPLNPRLGKLRGISAAAISEDGTPILILDIQDLLQTMDYLISGDRLKRIDPDGQILSESKSTAKRILVVDDSATVREVERKMLSAKGYEVDTAVDGIDAWNTLKLTPYDLIITDVDMPHMDGIELVQQIKGNMDYRGLPVIIVSYKDREEDRNRGLDAGADYYLTKGSFQDSTLIDAVEDLIGGPSDEY